MPPIPSAALLLVGFTLAHAVWSVSDTEPKDLLTPMMMVVKDGARTLRRFEAPSQVEAIQRGKSEAANLSAHSDGWAFAREGAYREPSGSDHATDVIAIDFWVKGMRAPAQLIQRFKRATANHGFVVSGQPMLLLDGQLLTAAVTQPMLGTIMQGVNSHPQVAPLWPTWR